jgi:predicted NodU family carbamoyl transferase
MHILGFHGLLQPCSAAGNPLAHWQDLGYHNSAAALLTGDEIVAAVEEERLVRNKNTGQFPAAAIRYCLSQCRAGRIEAVGFGEEGGFGPHRTPSINEDAVRDLLESEAGLRAADTPIILTNHHRAHAYSAAYASGFADALVVTLDGHGDGIAGSFASMVGGSLGESYRLVEQRDSLGHFYSAPLPFLGYEDGDEYKVMGLAPYGDPTRFQKFVEQLYELEPEGRFAVRCHDREQVFEMLRWFATPRLPGGRFEADHADIAAAFQAALERMVVHALGYEVRSTAASAICIAGGVAHNSSMMRRFRRDLGVDDIFVQPAADDAGLALGAAYHAADRLGMRRLPTMRHAFLGPAITDVDRLLASWESAVEVEATPDPAGRVAELLAAGEVVGVARGRMEFGPRALGNRSILADPRPVENRVKINAMVKSRESYRPFAPVVLEDQVGDYFELGFAPDAYRFMTIVAPVVGRHRSLLGAVTHVDGSARVQTVNAVREPFLHAVLRRFQERTGLPVLLNTSLNNHREPIVSSTGDAIVFLLTSAVDCVLIQDTLVRRRAGRSPVELMRRTDVRLRSGVVATAGPSPSTDELAYRVIGPSRRAIAVREPTFRLLTGATSAAGPDDEVLTDLFRLWIERLVTVRPR